MEVSAAGGAVSQRKGKRHEFDHHRCTGLRGKKERTLVSGAIAGVLADAKFAGAGGFCPEDDRSGVSSVRPGDGAFSYAGREIRGDSIGIEKQVNSSTRVEEEQSGDGGPTWIQQRA